LNTDKIEERLLPRTVGRIEESCLLLSVRWKTLKPTYFKFEGIPIYISNDIVAFRINESKIDPDYLISEMQTDSVVTQADSYRIDTIIPDLKKEDLLRIKIELPSLEEQRGKVKGLVELSKKIISLEEEKNALVQGNALKEFDEFASLKHSLGAPRQSILSNSKSLIRFFERNNSDAFIEVQKEFKDFYDIELTDVLTQMRDSINHISVILEKGEGGLILKNYEKELFSLKEINRILTNYSDNEYKFTKRYEPLKDNEIAKNALNLNTTLFKILIDNILNNADKYGFIEKTPGNEVIIELKPSEEILEVSIKNNGMPFPANYNKEKFIAKFTTEDSKKGSGLGGYDINRIANYFGDKNWQLILDDKSLYPVEFKFNFPLKNIDNE
jgi:type I restriction enzyme M protein